MTDFEKLAKPTLETWQDEISRGDVSIEALDGPALVRAYDATKEAWAGQVILETQEEKEVRHAKDRAIYQRAKDLLVTEEMMNVSFLDFPIVCIHVEDGRSDDWMKAWIRRNLKPQPGSKYQVTYEREGEAFTELFYLTNPQPETRDRIFERWLRELDQKIDNNTFTVTDQKGSQVRIFFSENGSCVAAWLMS